MTTQTLCTADICDAYPLLPVVEPMFRSFGGAARFSGPIETVKVFEDNTLVRDAVSRTGEGRVLVVDGGGSRRCALLGDRLARLASSNDWAGVVVFGSIRDAAEIATIGVGVLALGTHPKRSEKTGAGRTGDPVTFGGVTFRRGEHLYADEDGIVISPEPVTLEPTG